MRAICNCGWGLPVCLALVSLVGCNQQEERFAVSGQVTLDGKPVPKAVVAFEPVGANDSSNAICLVKDGRFELKAEAGIRAGKYAVRISDEKPDLEEFEDLRFSGKAPIAAPSIPVAYSQRDAFELSIDGPRSDLLFEMQSKK